jgi:hypothetical protein
MPPPQISIFRSSGSKDDANIQTTGYEFFKILKLHRNKSLLIGAFVASAAAGCMPFLMSTTLGGMMDSVTTGGDFLNYNRFNYQIDCSAINYDRNHDYFIFPPNNIRYTFSC